ncbi:interferon regulatory factor 1-like [Oncorhynchus kisutch]|uniref:Interferon regulatory factor n=1 Tax=Oncorhynchus kisutch TaxID=8019 RepID=A0A8C7GYL0_ONCKI|nr:interferon regulatory factor 1-like [Oncorhynchus kisutch]
MPVSRMRMRPWLEDKIESNSISGLVWVDKDKKIFSIPWKHAARHGWDLNKDACLFKQWAMHTGKFIQGETTPDPKTWKANFRCAMNSLPDIKEVKDKSINRGSGAVRVYKMLNVSTKPNNKRSKAKDAKKNDKGLKIKTEEMDNSATHCLEDRNTNTHLQEDRKIQENKVDSSDNLGETITAASYLDGSVNDPDVPDFITSVEIGPDSINYYSSFQVSPDHSTDYEDLNEETLIEIAQHWEQLEQLELPGSVNSKGFLSNEVATVESYNTAESNHSPESQWSDNSGSEIELRLYTELSPGLPMAEDLVSYADHWALNNTLNNNTTSYLQQISCPL